MKKYLYAFVLVLTMLPISMNAQQPSFSISKLNPDKLIYGGSLGFGLSNDFWSLSVSPQAGYKLSSQFLV